jgi:serine/threonine protein kinase
MAFSDSVFWMAPEVVVSSGTGLTSKVDIWGLGCVLFELWSERRPWDELSAAEVVSKVLSFYFHDASQYT